VSLQVEAGGRSYQPHLQGEARLWPGSTRTLPTIHWHGLGVPVEMDGHPTRHVYPGRAYRYAFSMYDAASTYWYHPHPSWPGRSSTSGTPTRWGGAGIPTEAFGHRH
jgi:FtsP/CotA-like multicopper oxidase with cupredoxin domain